MVATVSCSSRGGHQQPNQITAAYVQVMMVRVSARIMASRRFWAEVPCWASVDLPGGKSRTGGEAGQAGRETVTMGAPELVSAVVVELRGFEGAVVQRDRL